MRYKGRTRKIGEKQIINGYLYHVEIVPRMPVIKDKPLRLRAIRTRMGKGSSTIIIGYDTFAKALYEWELV